MKITTEILNKRKWKRLLFIPDLHLPYTRWEYIKEIKRFNFGKQYRKAGQAPSQGFNAELIVQLGDFSDQKCWSDHPKDPDDCPRTEWDELLRSFDRMHSMFPEMAILFGNHDLRVMRKAYSVGFPKSIVEKIMAEFDMPGWFYVPTGEHLKLQSGNRIIMPLHGDEQGGSPWAKVMRNHCSIIQGHTHKQSYTEKKILGKLEFGAELGTLVDWESRAVRYASRNPLNSDYGFGSVDYGKLDVWEF